MISKKMLVLSFFLLFAWNELIFGLVAGMPNHFLLALSMAIMITLYFGINSYYAERKRKKAQKAEAKENENSDKVGV